MIANIVRAIPPRIATRSASCGVIGGRRSSGSWSWSIGGRYALEIGLSPPVV